MTTSLALPARIRLSRARGFRKPVDAITVSRPSKWANPFTVADCLAEGFADNETDARRVCVDTHRRWLTEPDDPDLHDIYWVGKRHYDRAWVLANIYHLAGRPLACWCPPGPCHAATLIELAAKAVAS